MYTVHFIGLWGKKGFLLPELELPEELLFLQTVLEMSVQLSTISSSSLHLVVTKEMILSSRQNEKLVINYSPSCCSKAFTYLWNTKKYMFNETRDISVFLHFKNFLDIIKEIHVNQSVQFNLILKRHVCFIWWTDWTFIHSKTLINTRDVTIHSTHDSIYDFDFTIWFDSWFYLNKMRFKTNYKLNVSFYYCLKKMLHVSLRNWNITL